MKRNYKVIEKSMPQKKETFIAEYQNTDLFSIGKKPLPIANN